MILPLRNGSDNNFRILIVNVLAGLADESRKIIARRNRERCARAALTTELDRKNHGSCTLIRTEGMLHSRANGRNTDLEDDA